MPNPNESGGFEMERKNGLDLRPSLMLFINRPVPPTTLVNFDECCECIEGSQNIVSRGPTPDRRDQALSDASQPNAPLQLLARRGTLRSHASGLRVSSTNTR